MASSYSGLICSALSRACKPASITGPNRCLRSSLTFLSLMGPGSSCFMPLFLVEVEGSDGSDGDGVFGFLLQHLLEIVEGGSGHLVILWRIRAGDVLLHVGCGQIQAGGGKPRIEFDSCLEALDGLRILGGGKRLHALIELIARLELVTAHAKDRQRGHGEDQHYLAHIIARPPPSQSSDRLYRSRRRERCRSPWLPIGSLWKGRP